MALNTILFINDVQADYFQASDFGVKIFKQYFDINNLSERKGDYTLNLSLPRTDHNFQLFGYLGDIQSRDNFFSQRTYKVRIEADSSLILKGTLTIDTIDPQNYNCSVVGENIDWFSQLDSKTLRDIKSLPCLKYTGIRSQTTLPFLNQEADSIGLYDIWQTNEGDTITTIPNAQIIEPKCNFPLISYGNLPADPDSFAINPLNNLVLIRDSADLIDGAIFDQTLPYDFYRFKPCGYIRKIVEAIFKDLGYTVEGEFFSSDKFKDFILAFTDSNNEDVKWNYGLLAAIQLFVQPLSIAGTQFNLMNVTLPSNQTTIYPQFTSDSGTQDAFQNPTGDAYTDYLLPLMFDRTNISRTYFYDYSFSRFMPEWDPNNGSNGNQKSFYFEAPEDGTWDFNISLTLNNWVAFYLRPYQTYSINPDPRMQKCIFYIQKVDTNAGNAAWNQIPPNASSNFVGAPDFSGDLGLEGSEFILNNTVGTNILAYEQYDFELKNYNNTTDVTDSRGSHIVFLNATNVSLKKGDKIFFAFSTFLTENGLSLSGNQVPHGLKFLTGSAEFGNILININGVDNRSLCLAKCLPDMDQSDFIRSIIRLFNLYFFVDPVNKKITINPRKSYFFQNNTAVDWSEKCSLDEKTIMALQNYKQYLFEYSQEDGELLFTKGAYDETLISSSAYFKDTLVIDLPFSPTADRNYLLYPIQPTDLDRNILIPTMNNADELAKKLGDLANADNGAIWKFDYNPRILKWLGLQELNAVRNLTVNDVQINSLGLFVGGGNFVYPRAKFIVDTDTFTLSWNDDFGQKGLVTTFWSNDIAQIQKSVLISLPVMLTARDIELLDVRRPIKIQNELFIINSIDGYDPITDRLTRVILFKK